MASDPGIEWDDGAFFMKKQMVIAVSGVKNAGKTTLIEKLIPLLAARGISIATVKHDGHCFEADRPGTDSYRHLAAGALGTAVFDGEKFQLVKRCRVDENQLITLFPEADLILLEGLKSSAWPKIEVVRKAVSSTPVCREEELLAIVTDVDGLTAGVPVFSFRDTEKLADRILERMTDR